MIASHRNPSKSTPFLFLLAAAFVTASLFARDVFAHERPKNLDVRFAELDATMVHGRLQVTYEIAPKDWRELKRLHIRPKLNLYTPESRGVFVFTQSVEVTSRSATIEYPRSLSPDRGRFVELRLTGERGRNRIVTTSYRTDCGDRVRLAVNRQGGRGHHHGHGQNNDVAIIQACSKNTTWSGDLNQCITKAQNVGQGAPATINACGAASSWSGDFLACLDLAADLRRNKVGVIRECSSATSWSGDFKACLKSAAGYHADASPTIAACKAATSWSGDFKACLDQARPLGPRAPRVVDACGAATSWSGEFKQCLAAARRS